MSPRIEFDWDKANIGHVARHSVLPEEAEQVILNNPVDLGMEIVKGEERYLNLGATLQGRILRCDVSFRQGCVKRKSDRKQDYRRLDGRFLRWACLARMESMSSPTP